MLVKITVKQKEGYWYNVGEVHNVLKRSYTERSPWSDRECYILKQDVYGRSKGYRMIDVTDCEVIK